MLMKPPVFRQRQRIPGPQLADAVIQKAPPGCRPFPDQIQVLRAKQHRLQHPGKLSGGALFCPVSENLPPPGEQQPPEGLVPILRMDFSVNFPEFRPESDHFRIFLGPEAAPAA